MKRILLLLVSVVFLNLSCYGQNLVDSGEQALMEGNMEKAESLFLASLGQNPSQGKPYIYLGFIYEKSGARDKAVQILSRGLNQASSHLAQINYNLGNVQFAQAKYDDADKSYSEAIRINSSYAPAVLNRANSRLQLKEFQDCLNDYILYLNLKPDSSQKENIEKVIALLQQYMAEEEQRKLAEAEAKRIAEEEAKKQAEQKAKDEEQKRLEEEARQKEEAARQQALLDDILNSLQNAGDNTEGISAESEGLEDYDYDIDIED
ncbi:hypothetical protein [Spirochaeta cellobiosiphila]|uniref:hypothetical protein n=1 Tax=Spirochaeta cellobiosiphila TaxID=504483 RepID=UPI00041DFF51|nr:hypothetical protein [Spirochaeta cellobiosiphila]